MGHSIELSSAIMHASASMIDAPQYCPTRRHRVGRPFAILSRPGQAGPGPRSETAAGKAPPVEEVANRPLRSLPVAGWLALRRQPERKAASILDLPEGSGLATLACAHPRTDSPRVSHRWARMVRGRYPEPAANHGVGNGGQGRNRTNDTRIFSSSESPVRRQKAEELERVFPVPTELPRPTEPIPNR